MHKIHETLEKAYAQVEADLADKPQITSDLEGLSENQQDAYIVAVNALAMYAMLMHYTDECNLLETVDNVANGAKGLANKIVGAE